MKDSNMDEWILEQLRSSVLFDLKDLIDDGCFVVNYHNISFNKTIDKTGLLSKKINLGHSDYQTGKCIFYGDKIVSSRQKSASELLMMIGIYSSVRASQKATEKVQELQKGNIEFSSIDEVVKDFDENKMPEVESNIRESFKQYIRHLSSNEAKPFFPLLNDKELIELGFKESCWHSCILPSLKKIPILGGVFNW